MTTLQQSRFQNAIADLPAFSLTFSVEKEVADLVLDILEEYYDDGIDRLISADLDEVGDIVGEFSDRIGLRQVKRFRYKITDDSVSYRLVNPNEVEGFAIEVFAPRKKAKGKPKKRNCKKGIACGGSCINAKKTCRKQPTKATQAKIKNAKSAIAAGSSGTATPTPQPAAPKNVPANLANASADIQTIAAGIATGDIDSMIDAVDRIYDAGKTQAQIDGVSFYQSIRGGNGTTDPLTTVVLTEAGFNKPPTQITKAAMNNIDRSQNLVFYRNPSKTNFSKRFKQFKDADGADYTSGRGIYCSGTYVGADYSGKNGAKALAAAQGYGTGTMRMAMDRSANIVKAATVNQQQQRFMSKLDQWRSKERKKSSLIPI